MKKINIDSDPAIYSKMRDYIILLDAGHAQSTAGKKSPDNRLQEWKFNRIIANKLAAKLSKTGFDVRIICPQGIREDEIDIPLKERVARVNEIVDLNSHKKCILISIHANAHGAGDIFTKPHGFSVFVANKCSKASKKLAKTIYDTFIASDDYDYKGDRATPPEHYWQAGFAMVRLTNCPAVLTESLFYTNKDDIEWMLSSEGQDSIAQLHHDAIVEYCLA